MLKLDWVIIKFECRHIALSKRKSSSVHHSKSFHQGCLVWWWFKLSQLDFKKRNSKCNLACYSYSTELYVTFKLCKPFRFILGKKELKFFLWAILFIAFKLQTSNHFFNCFFLNFILYETEWKYHLRNHFFFSGKLHIFYNYLIKILYWRKIVKRITFLWFAKMYGS